MTSHGGRRNGSLDVVAPGGRPKRKPEIVAVLGAVLGSVAFVAGAVARYQAPLWAGLGVLASALLGLAWAAGLLRGSGVAASGAPWDRVQPLGGG